MSAPTIRITRTSQTAKGRVCVGRVPKEGGTVFFAATAPARARTATIGTNRPSGHGDAAGEGVEERGGVEPGEGRAVVVRHRGEGIDDLGEAVSAGVQDRVRAGRDGERDAGEDQDEDARREDGHDRHLHLEGPDLLAEVLGRPADHQPGDEDRDDDERDQGVEARADAAEDDLAEEDQGEGHEPAEGGQGVVHRVDRPARGGRGRGGVQRGPGEAEADLLSLHRDPRDPREERVPGELGRVQGGEGPEEEGEHHAVEDVPLSPVADGLAEHERDRGRDEEEQEDLDQVGERGSGSRRGGPSSR